MMHRTQDTYSLTDLREKTGEHLARLAEGRVETITQNGEAAMVVMSPERYDFLVQAAERGHIWREAILAYRAGERGVPAEEAVREIADELGVEL
jgi:prevent-host-death family protein